MAEYSNLLPFFNFEAEIFQRMDPCIRICKIYMFKYNVTFYWILNGLWRVYNIGFGIQEFVDPFLRCRSPLDHASRPPDGTHREREHVDIHYELCYRSYRHVMSSIYCINTSYEYRKQGA